MNIINNYKLIKNINSNYSKKTINTSFKASIKTDNSETKSPDQISKPAIKKFGRLKTYFLAGLVALSGAMGCNSNKNTVSGFENREGTEIRYYNIEQETKDSIAVSIERLKEKLTDKNDFLKDVQIDITKDYSCLNDSDAFSRELKSIDKPDLDKGVSYYSDSKVQKKIVVQESAHGRADKRLSAASGGNYSIIPSLRHTLIHEAGHHFDSYFGHDHNADFAKKWDFITANKENPYTLEVKTEEEKDCRLEYYYNAHLSDKQDFQEALYKDILHVAKLKKANSPNLACGIDYYTQNIDLSKKITPKDIEVAEFARSEVYANLFAYAMGENDGDKEDFIENFQNAYKVVQKDIAKYIGE